MSEPSLTDSSHAYIIYITLIVIAIIIIVWVILYFTTKSENSEILKNMQDLAKQISISNDKNKK